MTELVLPIVKWYWGGRIEEKKRSGIERGGENLLWTMVIIAPCRLEPCLVDVKHCGKKDATRVKMDIWDHSEIKTKIFVISNSQHLLNLQRSTMCVGGWILKVPGGYSVHINACTLHWLSNRRSFWRIKVSLEECRWGFFLGFTNLFFCK